MGSLHDAVSRILNQIISARYPHIAYPACAYAQVTNKRQDGEAYRYGVRLMTPALRLDSTIPEIPGIGSKLNLEVGDLVAVVLPYGQLSPYIIGKAVVP